MSREELKELLQELNTLKIQHHEEFEKWYDQANLLDVHDYCFSGWLLDRKLQ
jgi:rubrerythrin